MDLKCFKTTASRRSVSKYASHKQDTMQVIYFTTISVFALAWFCLLVILKSTLISRTSIQFNINANGDVSKVNAVAQKMNETFKNKVTNTKYQVPKYMLELYEKNKVKRDHLAGADVIRSIIPKHAGAMDTNVIKESENHLLIFDLPSSDEEEQFLSAELRILTLVDPKSQISGVERHLKISTYDDFTKTLNILEEIHIHHLNNTWLSFNVTNEVIKILKGKDIDKKIKIVISVYAFLPYYRLAENQFKLSLMPIDDNFDHDYPILLLSYTFKKKESKRIRKRRSVEEDYEEETNKIWDNNKKIKRNSCRRKPLYIEFSEINFDIWIVQPRGYEAYQCQGKCFYPVADHLNPTKHAIVQALLHSVAPSKVSRSCCVPTLLDSISILYVDNNGILTYRYAYKDMVVLECGCR